MSRETTMTLYLLMTLMPSTSYSRSQNQAKKPSTSHPYTNV